MSVPMFQFGISRAVQMWHGGWQVELGPWLYKNRWWSAGFTTPPEDPPPTVREEPA